MEEYGDVYNEVLEVLKYVPEQDYKKIPTNFIDFLESNRDEKNDFVYNLGLPLEKQNLSREAKTILAIICKLYWNK